MNLWKALSGILTVELTGAEPERALKDISHAGISISSIQKKTDLTYRFQIFRTDQNRLASICQRRGDRLSIIGRHGVYWYFSSLRSRPVLAAGFLILLISAIYLPSRVLFIEVSGNQSIPEKQILDAAENCGISFGASRKEVRSEKVKNALLSAVPQLQWAGVNTSGCRAVISVRERSRETPKEDGYVVSSLVAARDGYILSETVTSGTAVVQPGDIVTKGQLLVSGYTDCGFCIQATRAAGEIFAQTSRKLTAVTPDSIRIRRDALDAKYQISLLFQKKRINLWKDSRISHSDCGRMYTEYFVSLPGGFQLPIAICIDRYVNFETQNSAIEENTVNQNMQTYTDDYLIRQMLAGQILEKQQHITASHGLYLLESKYTCTEMIGIEEREQIGEWNGKRN